MTNEDRALLRLAQTLREQGYAFTTVTPATHARVNARAENRTARSLVDVFGWSRPFSGDIVPAPILVLMREAGILADEGGGTWRSRVRLASLAGELFVHSGFPTVEADAVFFGPDTYRFARAIQAALQARRAPIERGADIGCGAGPAAILVAKAAPEAEVVMADINTSALRLARINAALAGTRNAIACRSNILSEVHGTFDLIVSNPPYLNDAMARAYRHGGGAFGADLSVKILDAALERLAPRGTLLLYTGTAIVNGEDLFLAQAIPRLGDRALDWSYEEADPDVFGEELESEAYRAADRIAAVVLHVTKRS